MAIDYIKRFMVSQAQFDLRQKDINAKQLEVNEKLLKVLYEHEEKIKKLEEEKLK